MLSVSFEGLEDPNYTARYSACKVLSYIFAMESGPLITWVS